MYKKSFTNVPFFSLVFAAQVLLIPHMTIHQPLANLIAGIATMQMAGEVVDALALLKTILTIVDGDKMLGEFLIVVPVI